MEGKKIKTFSAVIRIHKNLYEWRVSKIYFNIFLPGSFVHLIRPHTGSPGPSAPGVVDLHRSLSMPAQTTTNGPQLLLPQRSSGSGGDEEPASDIEEDEVEEENIDVDQVDDDITQKGDVLVSHVHSLYLIF